MNLKGAELVGSGEPLVPKLSLRLIGHQKNGKTHFALTASVLGPLVFFNFNDRADGVIERFANSGSVYQYRYRAPLPDPGKLPKKLASVKMGASLLTDTEKIAWEQNWLQFQRDWYGAIAEPDVRTLVIDTESELWELRRLAQWGRAASVPGQFTALNKDMQNLFEATNRTRKNLIVISELKKQYVGGKKKQRDGTETDDSFWTGDYEPSGWSRTQYKVDCNAAVAFDPVEKKFSLNIINCGLDPMLAGDTLSGPACTFPQLAWLMYPDTEPEDWGIVL